MATITLSNLSRRTGLNLMNRVANHIGFAVQGHTQSLWCKNEVILATLRSEDGGDENTFNISSNYFVESTLREIIE